MKNVFFIALIALLASCSPTKRLARLLERYPIPATVDTVLTPGATIYKDTTVYKYLPGETVVENVYIDVPIAIPDTFVEAKTSTAKAIAWVQDNNLGLQLIQYDTVIQWKIDSALVTHTDTMIITKDIPYPVIEKVGVKEYWRVVAIVLGLIVLVAMFLLFRRKR